MARAHNRKVRFGLNGFAIVRDTEAEAREQLREIIAKADEGAVDLILTGFLHFQEELEAFGKTVIPIVREKEAELVNRGLLTPAGV